MLINDTLGLYVPRCGSNMIRRDDSGSESSSRSCMSNAGGLAHRAWSDFIFDCCIPVSSFGLKGGAIESVDMIVNPFQLVSYRNFLVMYCSFVDGLDRGIRFPMLYILKTQFGLTQAIAFTAMGVSMSPWLLKPLIALFTDTIPIFGLRRKPYLIVSAAVNAISLCLIGYFSITHIGGFLVPMSLMTLRTITRCVTGSVAQGMLIEDCQDQTQSFISVLMSQYHTSHRMGQFLSVCFSGWVLSSNSLAIIFEATAAFHFGSMAFAFALNESPVLPIQENTLDDLPYKIDELREVVATQPRFKDVLGYSFLAMASPTYEARMAYYLLDDRGLSVAELSLVTVAQTVAATITPLVYSVFFQKANLNTLMNQFTIATVPASLLPLILTSGLSSYWGLSHVVETAIAAGSGFFLTLSTDLQMMPGNVLVARLSAPGLEGASFSLFTVMEGMGRVCSNISSGVLPLILGASSLNGYANMSMYILVCSAFQLAPLRSSPVALSIEDEDEEVRKLSDDEIPTPSEASVILSN